MTAPQNPQIDRRPKRPMCGSPTSREREMCSKCKEEIKEREEREIKLESSEYENNR